MTRLNVFRRLWIAIVAVAPLVATVPSVATEQKNPHRGVTNVVLVTHRQAPLSEGTVDGSTVTCPLHGAQFNVWTGAVLRGPANDPLKTYRVTVDGDVGRVEVPLAQAGQGR